MNTKNNVDIPKIYMDYNATTPLAQEVIDSITKSLYIDWGNPSSNHSYGITARDAVSKAREQVAAMLNAHSSEIIFTSGGTEANNMVIYGIVQYFKQYTESQVTDEPEKPHIITTNVEHDSVVLPVLFLKDIGVIDCTIVKANKSGVVEPSAVLSHVTKNTCLISIMTANNETGVIMPIREIGRKLEELNSTREENGLIRILFHTDAAQIIGKEKVDVNDLKVNYLTVVGHKFYGPRIGCIFARGPLYRVFHGGGQEFGFRPGTQNTPMIVGLGTAAELVTKNVEKYRAHMIDCRENLEFQLKERFGDGVVINCEDNIRLPNTTSASFVGDGLEGNLLLNNCKSLIASVGAACHTGKCSQILINSGIPPELAQSAIRLSLGRDTTLADIEIAVSDLILAVEQVKQKIVVTADIQQISHSF